jgi:hypothetical protein
MITTASTSAAFVAKTSRATGARVLGLALDLTDVPFFLY